MAIKLSQSLKQTQNLMMTPQLQQAIKLLTLTHMEMTNVIAEEMNENPLLEEMSSESSSDDYNSETLEAQNVEAGTENFNEAPLMAKENEDFDWNSYVEISQGSSSGSSMSQGDPDDTPNYENIVSTTLSLSEHLEWQLRMENLTKEELEFSRQIIGNLNDDGYLSIDFEELIEEANCDREFAFSVLDHIQRLDPIGCGSRNLTDCLLAQATIMEERSPLLEKLIRDHLEDLQCKNYAKIAKETGVSSEMVHETALLLHQFHPKPGRLISPGQTQYIVPDIYIQEVGGKYVVNVNDEGVPKLRISSLYKSFLKGAKGQDKETKDYVEEKMRSALWLIKSIQNRKRTIVKVAEAIVSKQQQFFKQGPKALKPMILKDVADEIGMHESTVSRVTTNKYMHSHMGVFELKYFFNTGLGGDSEVASEVLKLKIKELIDNETPKRTLSDQKLVELLKRDNIDVARRTVAKYRESMGILSSAKRKLKT